MTPTHFINRSDHNVCFAFVECENCERTVGSREAYATHYSAEHLEETLSLLEVNYEPAWEQYNSTFSRWGCEICNTKPNPRDGIWQDDDVISYIIESYAGVEDNDRGALARQFIWEDEENKIWIGNSSAFAEHLSMRFNYPLKPYDFVSINNILIRLGERLLPKKSRTAQPNPNHQPPMAPNKRRVT